MKKFKFLPIFLCVCLLAGFLPAFSAGALDDPEIQSRVAIVMDKNTGEVFYSQNSDQVVYPASTTKIMTVLLAVEAIEAGEVSLYDEVTASSEIEYDLIEDGSTAGIVPGERMTLENLLYCAMLVSANEACNIIAEYIGGTIRTFIARMNARAAELGCQNTHFANTHGLPNEDHYTTADDFCLLITECVAHDLFMQICNTASHIVPATNMHEVRNLTNSNALISKDSVYGPGYFYPKAAGIKTGSFSAAGYCLVSSASNDDIELIAAVFGGYASKDDDGKEHVSSFEDSITLYDWVFNNFSFQDIIGPSTVVTSVPVRMAADAESVKLRAEESLTALLPNDFVLSSVQYDVTVYGLEEGEEALVAPISAGEVLGEVTLSIDDEVYGSVKLVAATGLELSRWQFIKTEVDKTLHSGVVRIGALVLLGLLALYLIFVVRYRILHLRHKRKARAYNRAHPRGEREPEPEQEFPQVNRIEELEALEEKQHRRLEAENRRAGIQAPADEPLRTRTRRHAEQDASPAAPADTGHISRQNTPSAAPADTGYFFRQNTPSAAPADTGRFSRQNTPSASPADTGHFSRQNTPSAAPADTGRFSRQNTPSAAPADTDYFFRQDAPSAAPADISYFSQEEIAPRRTSAPATEADLRREQAERDYFEEFFRQK